MRTRDKERLKVFRKMRRAVPKIPGLSAETLVDPSRLSRNLGNIRMTIKWRSHLVIHHLFLLEVPSPKVAWVYPNSWTKELHVGRITTIAREVVDLTPSPQVAMRTICTIALRQFLDHHTIILAKEFAEEMALISRASESIKQHERRNTRANAKKD